MNFLKSNYKALFVVLAFLCVGWSMRGSASDFKALPHPNIGLLVVAGVMFMIHYFMQATAWHLLLGALGQKASPRVTMKMWYMSLIARWMPGRVWYTASRLLLAKQNNLSVAAVSFAIVMELVYILVAGAIVTLCFFGAVMHGVMTNPHSQVILGIVGAAAFLCASLVVRPETLLKLYDLKAFKKLITKVPATSSMRIARQN